MSNCATAPCSNRMRRLLKQNQTLGHMLLHTSYLFYIVLSVAAGLIKTSNKALELKTDS